MMVRLVLAGSAMLLALLPGAAFAQAAGVGTPPSAGGARGTTPAPQAARAGAPDEEAPIVHDNSGGAAPKRIRNVQLAPGQPCPAAEQGEIVVCPRIRDPYRIPPQFRQLPRAGNNSWVNRAAVIDEVGRTAGGLPNTCSPVGTGGQTGCAQAIARQYSAEKRQQKADQAQVP